MWVLGEVPPFLCLKHPTPKPSTEPWNQSAFCGKGVPLLFLYCATCAQAQWSRYVYPLDIYSVKMNLVDGQTNTETFHSPFPLAFVRVELIKRHCYRWVNTKDFEHQFEKGGGERKPGMGVLNCSSISSESVCLAWWCKTSNLRA